MPGSLLIRSVTLLRRHGPPLRRLRARTLMLGRRRRPGRIGRSLPIRSRVGSTARPGSRPRLSGTTTGGRLRPLRRGTLLRVRSRRPVLGSAGGLLLGFRLIGGTRVLPVTAWLVGSAH
nr:hypothetical protein JVH1_4894 [Rhodococcus sp. JVH1]